MKPRFNLTGSMLKGLLAIFLFASCTNLEKAIDSGNYDQAISIAVKRLKGKTKKKQKHVAALEEGFHKANRRDMANINRLKTKDDAAAWEKVNYIARKIEGRQSLIQPLLPVIDKEGYKANFTFVKTDILISESEERAASLLYDDARELLALGKQGDKQYAREAFEIFDAIEKYIRNYKDARQLKAEARDLGIVHIGYNVENVSNAVLPRQLIEELEHFGTGQMNSFWKQFHVNPSPANAMDFELKMVIENVDVGPSLVRERAYTDSKEIEDGWRYVLDQNGNVLKDSLGNDVKEPNFVLVHANVLEVNLTKEVSLNAKMVLSDLATGNVLDTERLTGATIFKHCASTFTGDKRALSPATIKHLNDVIVDFPEETDMLFDAAYHMKSQITGKIKQMIIV